NLKSANLEKAKLIGVNFQHSNLNNAYLIGTDPRDANFRGANLKGTNLKGARLDRADFTEADLVEANLFEAHINQAIFLGADLQKAVWVNGEVCQPRSIGRCIQSSE
ncbi:MAG: pentapeptide repeat-containing protein, partial [Deltaproteobacteria bacterium]|nr:pentapeptide repeat-containing protein [Deltaproteobacteria bacterium]